MVVHPEKPAGKNLLNVRVQLAESSSSAMLDGEYAAAGDPAQRMINQVPTTSVISPRIRLGFSERMSTPSHPK